ncbi:MAG TPA: DMT family transporter [Acidimicrobiales bacterium]|nr:DMT family transporter [Acidimicrobiales bacterium]
MSEAGVIAIALASALAAAISSILQHHSARRAPDGRTHRLLGHLLTRPAWLIGLIAALVGLLLHVVALDYGQLAVVQPLLISGVLFALPISAILEGHRPSGREWLLAVAVVAGLALFLIAGRPSPGQVQLDADVLIWSTITGMAVVAVLAVVGIRWAPAHRCGLLGAAAGVGYGVVAALLKQATAIFHIGVVTLLTDWELYTLIAAGGVALALTQLSYRAGPLAKSMPALTVADPAASVVLGVLAFKETLNTSPLAIAGQVIGFVVMALAAAQLARREAEAEALAGDRTDETAASE